MSFATIRTLVLTAGLMGTLAMTAACEHGTAVHSSHVVAHSESDSKGWFGGQTHEANTTYKNADGSTSIETETTTAKNGTTTIVRERKTTLVDGSVKTDKETRTIVKGTDNVVRESKTAN